MGDRTRSDGRMLAWVFGAGVPLLLGYAAWQQSGILGVLGVAALVLLYVVAWVFRAASRFIDVLDPEVRYRPGGDEAITDEALQVVARLEGLGLQRRGPSFRRETDVVRIAVLLADAEEETWAAVFHEEKSPGEGPAEPPVVSLQTLLAADAAEAPVPGLDTMGGPAVIMFRPELGAFVQHLPAASPAELLDAHREGIAFLRDRGLDVRPSSAARMQRLLDQPLQATYERLRRAPVSTVATVLFRGLLQVSAVQGRVIDQRRARRDVARLVAAGDAGDRARPVVF